jgi:hypothetical protein
MRKGCVWLCPVRMLIKRADGPSSGYGRFRTYQVPDREDWLRGASSKDAAGFRFPMGKRPGISKIVLAVSRSSQTT